MSFNKKGAVLALAGVLALGGVGAASAFIINDAAEKTQTTTTESAVKLTWGSSTLSGNIDLKKGIKQVQKVEVVTNKTTSVTDKGQVTFTLGDNGSEVLSEYIVVEILEGKEFNDADETQAAEIHKLSSHTEVNTTTWQSAKFELTSRTYTYYVRYSLRDDTPATSADGLTAYNGKLTASLQLVK